LALAAPATRWWKHAQRLDLPLRTCGISALGTSTRI
jgi:hypothetical protein